MRATALEVTETTAVVELRPCWLARMFGARTLVVNLIKPHKQWLLARSWEPLVEIWAGGVLEKVEHGACLIRALDFRPVAKLPNARTVVR